MSAAKYDLKIARGEDFNFTLAITDSLNAAVDISTDNTAPRHTFKAEIREEFKKPLVQAFRFDTKTGNGTANDNIDPDAALAVNELRFKLTNEQTITFDVNKKYKWDFFWTDSGEAVHKLLYGDVIVSANITNV